MKKIKLYNVLFPIWMIVWFPTPLWLILIPLNYGMDYLVLRLTSKDLDTKLINKLSIKTCLIGFLADFVGALFLFLLIYLGGALNISIFDNIGWNPFASIISLFAIVVAIGISGFIIYKLNKKLFIKNNINNDKAKYISKWLTIITSPYLYLIPTMLFYHQY